MTARLADPGTDVVAVLRRFHAAVGDRRGEQDVVDAVASFAREAFAAASVTVNHMDHARGHYRSVVNLGHLGPGESLHPADETHGFADYPWTTMALLAGRGYRSHLSDPDCPLEYQQLLRRLGKPACLGAPIRRQGTVMGELWLSRDEAFADRDVDLLTALGAATARYL